MLWKGGGGDRGNEWQGMSMQNYGNDDDDKDKDDKVLLPRVLGMTQRFLNFEQNVITSNKMLRAS